MQISRLKSLPKSWRKRSVLLATICAAACAGNVGAQSPPSGGAQITTKPTESSGLAPLNSTLEIRVARRPWLTERKTPPKPAPSTTRPLPAPTQYPDPPYTSPTYPGPPSLSNFGNQRSIEYRSQPSLQNRTTAPFADLQQPQAPAPHRQVPAPQSQVLTPQSQALSPQTQAPAAKLQPMVIIERERMPQQAAPPPIEVIGPEPQHPEPQHPEPQHPEPQHPEPQHPLHDTQPPAANVPPSQLSNHRPDPQPAAQGDPYVLPELSKGRPWPPGPDPEPRPSTSPRSIREFLEETTSRSSSDGQANANMAAAAEPADAGPVDAEPVELEVIEPPNLAGRSANESLSDRLPSALADPAMDGSARVDDDPRPQDPVADDRYAEASQPLVPLDYAGFPRAKIKLTNTVARMKNPIRECLAHYYTQFELVQGRSNWGMLHAIMVYGIDTKVQAGDQTYSAIGWIAGNNICRGQRLVEEQNGKIFIKTGIGLQGHQAQMLAVFSLCDVPENYPIYAGDIRYSLRDVVDAEMAGCRSDAELTFTLIGLSHYLDTESIWLSDEDDAWNFERLLRTELSKPIVGAACGGTHRLMGFAHALRERRGEGRPIIGQWRRAEEFTQDFIEYAFQLQNSDGSMSTHWFEGREDNGDMDRKVQTTGHIVEWLLTALPDTDLQDPRLVHAVQYLLTAMSNNRTNEWSIGPKGHALRSLAMYYERVYKSGPAWRSQRMASSSSDSGR